MNNDFKLKVLYQTLVLVLMVMSFDMLRVWVFDTSSSSYFRKDDFFKNFICGQFGFDAVL